MKSGLNLKCWTNVKYRSCIVIRLRFSSRIVKKLSRKGMKTTIWREIEMGISMLSRGLGVMRSSYGSMWSRSKR